MTCRVALFGGGNMGLALATAMSSQGSQYSLVVADPLPSQRERIAAAGIEVQEDNRQAADSADVLLLAVKPQVLRIVVRELAEANRHALVISVAAGVRLATIESWFGTPRPIVRCMPNTPTLLGQGVAGLICNDLASAAHREIAESILGAGCELVWLDSDRDLDIVTAISGSGPAYFFYLMESLLKEAVRLGMEPQIAKTLVTQTAQGAAAMAAQLPEDPRELRRRVTSPNGTTQAAIERLEAAHVQEAFAQAASAAFHRSQEIGEDLARHA